jgi:hypothetical protein
MLILYKTSANSSPDSLMILNLQNSEKLNFVQFHNTVKIFSP